MERRFRRENPAFARETPRAGLIFASFPTSRQFGFILSSSVAILPPGFR
jgi:hypothetical protein